jgi:acetate kinase
MRILVVNSGSSSLKYQLLEVTAGDAQVLGRGLVEKIGAPGSQAADHDAAARLAFEQLSQTGAISHPDDIEGIGHRIVHGGELFTHSTVMDDAVVADIEACAELAPLHNPVNLKAYYATRRLAPRARHVAVFDTAFHTTLPPRAFLYGLPYHFYAQDKIRRYGFHGTSYRYLVERYAAIRGAAAGAGKLIACHLGNGCSVCAVDQGRSVDTSMGFTPLEGLLMGTRAGDIDAAAVLYAMRKKNFSSEDMEQFLNRECGLRGLSGISNDMRELLKSAADGEARSRDAVDIFCYRICKYIGAYFAALGGADALIFAGGIGENSPAVRTQICRTLSPLGISLDEDLNAAAVHGAEAAISPAGAPAAVWVIPTNEELMIARDTYRCLA